MSMAQSTVTIQNKMSKIQLPSQREKAIPRRKVEFANKLIGLLDEYDTCLIVEVNHIGSKQIAEMRKAFRGRARFLFGKNTLIRKVIRDHVKQTRNIQLMKLMDLIKGNCGLVFTKEELGPIRKEIIQNTKQSAAKCGSIAPCDVVIPRGPTNMEPTKTHIFQAMDIETRINRGQIDVTSAKRIIKKGSKVGASEASLLSQLNIKPFNYGVAVNSIYNRGEIIEDCSFMDYTADDIARVFYIGLAQVAALCESLNYPAIINGIKLDNHIFTQLQNVQNTSVETQNAMDISTNNDDTKVDAVSDDEPDNSSSSEGGFNLFGKKKKKKKVKTGDESGTDTDSESDTDSSESETESSSES